MKADDPRQYRRPHNWITAGMFAVWIPLFAVGYALSELLFRLTGRPGPLWVCIISGMLGLLIFSLAIRIITYTKRDTISANRRWATIRNKYLDDTIEAMERIARGDFSVLIPTDESNPFSELTESVNRMAHELGTMEQLRQDFISNVSHEIQSPLTSIAGFASLLKNETISLEQRAHYIDVIETEARRLSLLSDNLLKLSALENGAQSLTSSSFSLDRQIQNAVLTLEPQWSAKNLELSLALDKITFCGDEALLIQVWINLIHNAIKFTPKNGGILVSLTKCDDTAVCLISDTGIGFSEEDRMHIFERFYKADKSRDRALGGNGLGLSLVKKIVELHGGTIDAESIIGKGSTFTVTLPIK